VIIRFQCEIKRVIISPQRSDVKSTEYDMTHLILDIQTSHCNNCSIKFNSNITSTVQLIADCPMFPSRLCSHCFPHVCRLIGAASYRLSTVIDYEWTVDFRDDQLYAQESHLLSRIHSQPWVQLAQQR
jgi:hypothetical protein